MEKLFRYIILNSIGLYIDSDTVYMERDVYSDVYRRTELHGEYEGGYYPDVWIHGVSGCDMLVIIDQPNEVFRWGRHGHDGLLYYGLMWK